MPSRGVHRGVSRVAWNADRKAVTAHLDLHGAVHIGLLPNGTLKTYKGFPHGMPTTQAETINADLLAFIQS
jgi:hypothetical protein